MNKPRIVFMGTPEFAAHSLQALHDSGANLVAVVTAPDRRSGRGMKLTSSAVGETAGNLGLPVLKPEKLKDPVFLDALRELKPDLQVVVAFRMLPEAVWALPPMGTFNLHASLLPQYRGAAPINHAIINGEKVTGVTTFFINHEIDTGNILFREEVSILDEDDAGTLHDKLMETGAQLIIRTIDAIASGKIHPLPQDELTGNEILKPAPKIFKEDCKIDWSLDPVTIHNKIRGLSPYPGAWTEFILKDGSVASVKIFRTAITNDKLAQGEISCDGKSVLKIGCRGGALQILELQLAGKKRLATAEFLRGFDHGSLDKVK